jgi:hypothetical protein
MTDEQLIALMIFIARTGEYIDHSDEIEPLKEHYENAVTILKFVKLIHARESNKT